MHILEYENYEETKKHYDTDFSYNTYPCSIPLDFPCVPLHWHRETEIIYVKSGRGMVNVDGISYPVVKDSIVFILPGRLHSIAQYESEAFSYENIIFDMQMLIPKEGDTMSFNFFHRLQNFPEDFPVLIDRVPKAHRAVQICLDRIDDLRTTYPAGYYLGIKGWLYQLFFILESEILAPDKMREITTCDLPQQKNSAVSSRKNGYFKENTKEKLCLITDYIANYYPQKISIEQIAAVCGFSSSHFMKFFKLYMGKPFIAYLNEYRLIRAAHLLCASDDDILAISLECGFENVSYFNRLFLREYHMTPSKFRQARRK